MTQKISKPRVVFMPDTAAVDGDPKKLSFPFYDGDPCSHVTNPRNYTINHGAYD